MSIKISRENATKNSEVFFIDLYSGPKLNLYRKLENLLEELKVKKKLRKQALVALKLHFGEYGNSAFIRPNLVRIVSDTLKGYGAVPFLTDTNTLYLGNRANAVLHAELAIRNGFAFSVTGAPVIIADGLRSTNEYEVKLEGEGEGDGLVKHFKKVYFGGDILNADFVVFLSHFKGHELSGFGGALKNISMGCATRKGKLQMHSSTYPNISNKRCTGCATCVEWCKFNAISLTENVAHIDKSKCVGCGECIIICPEKAIRINWSETGKPFIERMLEYVYGFCKVMKDKALFLNFITDVSPQCDCYGYNDYPVVPDIGILGSYDPVALDKASVDLVNKQEIINKKFKDKKGEKDIFKIMYPDLDYKYQFHYAEQLGIGTMNYKLIKI